MSFWNTIFGGSRIEAQVMFSQILVNNTMRSYEFGRISKEEALAKVNKERKSVGSGPLTDLHADEELRAKMIKKRKALGLETN